MSNQPRVAKVLGVLVLSMTIGAVVLMVLGQNPPSAGPFCLASYYRLDPIKQAISSYTPTSSERWNCIEICYSGTKAGNLEQLTFLNGLSSPDELNYHFIICNGLGGEDGQILPTEKWQRQWSCIPGRTWYGTNQTVRICIIADENTDENEEASRPSEYQIKRVEALVEGLCRKFTIASESIYYPGAWQ